MHLRMAITENAPQVCKVGENSALQEVHTPYGCIAELKELRIAYGQLPICHKISMPEFRYCHLAQDTGNQCCQWSETACKGQVWKTLLEIFPDLVARFRIERYEDLRTQQGKLSANKPNNARTLIKIFWGSSESGIRRKRHEVLYGLKGLCDVAIAITHLFLFG